MRTFKRCFACFVSVIVVGMSAVILSLPLVSCSQTGEIDSSDTALAECQDITEEKIVFQAHTPLIDKEPGRVNNIKKAAECINQVTLEEGAVFSFNEIVGERSVEKGYKKAAALQGKKKIREVGGGVCQLSTTVFQAASGAGLEIIERHKHQKKVPYTPKNTDATIAYGKFDLKFKNNSEKTLKIYSSITGNKVNVTIYEI